MSVSKKDRYQHLKSKTQRDFREMQDTWWQMKAEVEHYAQTQNSNIFFSAIKTLYGTWKPSTTQLLSADGTTLIKDWEGINER